MNRMEAAMMAIEQANTQMQAFVGIIGSIKEKTQIINEIVFRPSFCPSMPRSKRRGPGSMCRGFAVVAEKSVSWHTQR